MRVMARLKKDRTRSSVAREMPRVSYETIIHYLLIVKAWLKQLVLKSSLRPRFEGQNLPALNLKVKVKC